MKYMRKKLFAWLSDAGVLETSPATKAKPDRPSRSTYAYLGRERAVTHTHAGHLILLDTRDLGMVPHIALSGQWEVEVETTIRTLTPPAATVIEVGANHGYHTLALADAIGPQGHVHAFEPNPRLVPLLTATVALNGYADRVTVHPNAASSVAGEVALMVHPDHAGSGHLEVAAGGPGYSERHYVDAVRIDEAVGPGVAAAQLMRLDCEGAEPLALMGAEQLIRRSDNLTIVMEWSVAMMQARADVTAFVTWLRDLGFSHAWKIDARHPVPLNFASLPELGHSEIIVSRQAL